MSDDPGVGAPSYPKADVNSPRVSTYLRVKTLWLLCIPGVGLLLLGFAGDRWGWWADLGYTTNILAGVTAACFGVPIAAAVLQRFLRAENELLRRREILAIAQRTVSAIAESLDRLSADKADYMAGLIDQTRERIHAVDSRINPDFRFDPPPDLEDVQRSTRTVLDAAQQCGFGRETVNEAEFLSMRNRWRVFNETVRVQAELVGVRVVSDDVARNITHDFEHIENDALYAWLDAPGPDFCVVDLRSMMKSIREHGFPSDEISRYDLIVHGINGQLLEIVDTLNNLEGLRIEVQRAQSDLVNATHDGLW